MTVRISTAPAGTRAARAASHGGWELACVCSARGRVTASAHTWEALQKPGRVAGSLGPPVPPAPADAGSPAATAAGFPGQPAEQLRPVEAFLDPVARLKSGLASSPAAASLAAAIESCASRLPARVLSSPSVQPKLMATLLVFSIPTRQKTRRNRSRLRRI